MAQLELQRELRDSSAGDSGASKQFQFVYDLRVQYQRRRRCELSACAVGFLGILLMLAQNEVLMSDMAPRTKRAAVQWLKWFICVSTVALVLLVLLQFAASSQIARMQNVLVAKQTRHHCHCSARYVVLALELLVCGFHIPPGVTGDVEIAQFHSRLSADAAACPTNEVYNLVRRGNACYLVYNTSIDATWPPYDLSGVFMVLRLYLFARYMRSASTLYSQWVAFIGALNDVNAMRPFFHFKALFKIKPLHLLVPLTLLNMCLTAAAIRILESPVQAAFESYGKSLWLTAVTLSATGFGDYYPVTHIGRAVTTISAMFGGLLLVALIQSLFFGVLELSPAEHRVQHLVEMDRWEKATQQHAAALLQTAWRCHTLAATRDSSNSSEQAMRQLPGRRKLYALMRASRELRMAQPAAQLSLEDELAELTDTVLEHVNRMEREQQRALARIQEKVTRLAARKHELEAQQQQQRVTRGA